MSTPLTDLRTFPREPARYPGLVWQVTYNTVAGTRREDEFVAGTKTEVEDILVALGATDWEIG